MRRPGVKCFASDNIICVRSLNLEYFPFGESFVLRNFYSTLLCQRSYSIQTSVTHPILNTYSVACLCAAGASGKLIFQSPVC